MKQKIKNHIEWSTRVTTAAVGSKVEMGSFFPLGRMVLSEHIMFL